MRTIFSESFRKQAVEKAVQRSSGVTLSGLAQEWGVGRSTLQRWIRDARTQIPVNETYSGKLMKPEKRPQDWSNEEKLNMVIACGGLDEVGISELCREQGIYPHHVEQWKIDFVQGNSNTDTASRQADTKQLKNENKELKKELRRKEKALAETAALLVLQKKVDAIWRDGEDNLP
jgi:transposase-like protein